MIFRLQLLLKRGLPNKALLALQTELSPQAFWQTSIYSTSKQSIFSIHPEVMQIWNTCFSGSASSHLTEQHMEHRHQLFHAATSRPSSPEPEQS